VHRGPYAARDAERHHHDERKKTELRRVRQRTADERRDRLAICVRQAHVALHEVRDPLRVLREKRTVRAELMIERGNGARIGERAEYRAADIARQQLAAREHDHRQQPQRDQRQADPRPDEAHDAHCTAARATSDGSGNRGRHRYPLLAASRAIRPRASRDRNTAARLP
jgi:hypothetical protein